VQPPIRHWRWDRPVIVKTAATITGRLPSGIGTPLASVKPISE
jgi:hypothetical protein